MPNPSGAANSEEGLMVKSIALNSRLVDLSIPKSTLIYKDLIDNRYVSNNEQILHLIASLQDGTNCFIDLLNFNQISYSPPLSKALTHEEDNQVAVNVNKKLRVSDTDFILTLDQTFSGLVGVGVTKHSSLVVFRNLNFNQQLVPLLNLYEYHLLTGYDHWNLLMSTNPKQVESLIERLEEKYAAQVRSVQKMLYARFHTILFTLYQRRPVSNAQLNQFRTFDTMLKLIVNKSVPIMAYAIQLILNTEIVKKLELASTNASLDTKDTSLSIAYVMSNIETLNQSIKSPAPSESNNTFSYLSHVQFKNSLYEFFGDLLEQHASLRQMQLNDIVQFVLSKKNYELHVNQQLKHLFQFAIDVLLYLTNVVILAKSSSSAANLDGGAKATNKSYYGLSLLHDVWFLKEMLKTIILIKLVFKSAQQQQQQQQGNAFIMLSLPVLPLRSSMQKDLLNDLFNIYIKIYCKVNEGKSLVWELGYSEFIRLYFLNFFVFL